MTDFTIISSKGQGIGRFLYVQRDKDLKQLQLQSGTQSIGMFAEIYNSQSTSSLEFGNVLSMHPVVRREVLSHLGYRKLDFTYVHPSWDHEGKAVTELDLCFLPTDEAISGMPASLIVEFLRQYYEALPNKPKQWLEMVSSLEHQSDITLLPM